MRFGSSSAPTMDRRAIVTKLRRKQPAENVAEEGSTSVIAYELRENPFLPQNESDEEHLDMAQTEEVDFQTPKKRLRKPRTKSSSVKKAWCWKHFDYKLGGAKVCKSCEYCTLK